MLSKEEKADWQKLCDECSTAAKELGITKADTDRIIKETREMMWKADKYDELVKKLEEIDDRNTKLYNSEQQKETNFSEWFLAQELLSLSKEKTEQN